MTNYERIKNMSIEEMAKIINLIVAYCFNGEEIVSCRSIIAEWLKSEVKNEDRV